MKWLHHNDIIKWNHFAHYRTFMQGFHQSPVNSPPWWGALILYLICTWTNGWANNQDTSDLRCRHTHYDNTVMMPNRQWAITQANDEWVIYYNMVRWISAPGTMHFCPQYDTFWPCGLFTLLQHPPSKISMKLRWVSSVNLVNCGDIFNLLTILSSPEINDSF